MPIFVCLWLDRHSNVCVWLHLRLYVWLCMTWQTACRLDSHANVYLLLVVHIFHNWVLILSSVTNLKYAAYGLRVSSLLNYIIIGYHLILFYHIFGSIILCFIIFIEAILRRTIGFIILISHGGISFHSCMLNVM